MRLSKLCAIILWAFVALYFAALVIAAIGVWGLFGAARDPLSAVFLIPLGWPWNRLIDFAPAGWAPWLAAAAPALNALLMWVVGYIAAGAARQKSS